jgi:heme/copper-type cytochrome/quinol oxidase subunit 2
MAETSDVETADKLSRRRARMLPVLAILFLSQQASFFGDYADGGMRAVDHVKIGAWLVLSIVLLLALATGGSWFQKPEVRRLLNDENTRANRAEAFRVGFLATMIGAIILYFISLYEPMSGREAVHILTTIGLGAALLRFGFLERRAHRDA